MIDTPPVLNKSALQKLGWTPMLIAAVLDPPDTIDHHQAGYRKWSEHLYTRDRVDAGMRDPRFTLLVERRKLREKSIAKRREDIPKRYTEWREALPEAAAGMFSLNRYAKHSTCSPLHKQEIYHLKNAFIELLYSNGYCTASWIHRLNQEQQTCRACAGDGDGDFCWRCDGSGIWRPARVLQFWCFRFSIASKVYCWHQPAAMVGFTPAESLPPADWEGVAGEKPIALSVRKFAAVKELLRWIFDQASSEQFHESSDATPASPPHDGLPF